VWHRFGLIDPPVRAVVGHHPGPVPPGPDQAGTDRCQLPARSRRPHRFREPPRPRRRARYPHRYRPRADSSQPGLRDPRDRSRLDRDRQPDQLDALCRITEVSEPAEAAHGLRNRTQADMLAALGAAASAPTSSASSSATRSSMIPRTGGGPGHRLSARRVGQPRAAGRSVEHWRPRCPSRSRPSGPQRAHDVGCSRASVSAAQRSTASPRPASRGPVALGTPRIAPM